MGRCRSAIGIDTHDIWGTTRRFSTAARSIFRERSVTGDKVSMRISVGRLNAKSVVPQEMINRC